MRDAVGADDLQAARLPAEQVEGGAQGAYEQMVLVARQRLGALARDVDVQAGVGDPDDDVVVEAQREAQGVVAGAEVGAGGGDAHADSGGAERGTGHLPMTLLGWLTRFPVDRGDDAGPVTDPVFARIWRSGTEVSLEAREEPRSTYVGVRGCRKLIEGRFSGDIGRTGGARCVS